MRRLLGATTLTICVALAACVPTTQLTYWQPGVPPVTRQSDYTDCRVEAANRVPASMQIGTTPAYTTPVSTTCSGIGNSVFCSSTGGNVIGGNVYSYDANANIRDSVIQQCLARRGYQRITFPICTAEQRSRGVTPSLSEMLPPASEVLCVTGNGYVRQ